MSASIEISKVSKQYGGLTVLEDISLSVTPGEFVVFLGPSGCGKSTLLRMIAGLETLDKGSVHLGGQRIDTLPPGQRGVAMVFQSYALYPHMTVAQNMGFGLENIHLPKSEIASRVQSAAEVLEIAHLLDRKPAKLSGGQRQRVAIGRAIVKEPKAFLFDEPLSNLDAALRGRTRLELAQLHRRLGSTMIFVTHDQIEAMTLADRIVVMHNRKIEQVGTPMEIYRRPATRFVAGFVGTPAMSILPVRQAVKTTHGLRLDLGPAGTHDCAISVPDAVLAAGKMELGIRPEDIKVGPAGAADGFAAVAEMVERLGERTLVYATVDGGPNHAPIQITAEADGRSTLKAGQSITLSLDPAAFHLFGGDGQAFHAAEGA